MERASGFETRRGLCQFGPDVHLGCERQMDRAAIGNRQQPRTLCLVQDAFELDVSFNERELWPDAFRNRHNLQRGRANDEGEP